MTSRTPHDANDDATVLGPGAEPAGSVEPEVDTTAVRTPEVRAGAEGSMTGTVVRGASWTASSRLVSQGVQFLVGLILARLLLPAEFGLLASVYVISGFAVLFFDLGLGSALVHSKHLTEQAKSTVFWVNVLGGFVFAGLLAAAGPLVAAFYDAPALVWLTPLVGLSFTFAFGVVHNALLQRSLRFKVIAVIEVSSSVVGQGVTVGAALAGAGAYALAFGPMVTALLASVLSVSVVRWHPSSFISRAAMRDLWGYSGGLLGFNVVNYWGRNVDNLLVGRVFGAAPLGFYNRAYNLMLLPITQITGALGRVMFPALAAMQDDLPRVRSAYLRGLRAINAVTVPLLFGLAATADGLVPFLWGDQWGPSIPILKVLCLAGVPQCVSTTTGWLFQSQGRTNDMFRQGLISAAVGVSAIVVGLHWGPLGVAWAVLFRFWVMMPFTLAVAGRSIELRVSTVLRGAVPVVSISGLMALVVWSFPIIVGADRTVFWVLATQVTLGVVLYVAGALVFHRELVTDISGLVRRRRR